MAYSVTLPPALVAQSIGDAPAFWLYASVDAAATVAGANYFTNGKDLGMRVNDVVCVIKTTATIGATLHVVTAVTASGATVAAAILA